MARVLLCDPRGGIETLGRGSTAHEVLPRPFDAASLLATVQRALEVHSLLHDPELSRLIAELGTLPALPATYHALCRVVASPTASMGQIADVVMRDVAVTSRVLSVVNSALYNLPRKVKSVSQAVNLLGLSTVRDLVLAVEVFHGLVGDEATGRVLRELQLESHARAALGRVLSPRPLAEATYTSGLLLDLGRMVLLARVPDRYGAVPFLQETGLSRAEAEREVFGVTSRELGARLLALWGLPGDIVATVLEPDSGGPIADLVQLADLFVQEASHEAAYGEALVLVTRKMAVSWGLEDRVDLARHLARTMVKGALEPPVRGAA
jgi:HD-like signal output (HDOD) protein